MATVTSLLQVIHTMSGTYKNVAYFRDGKLFGGLAQHAIRAIKHACTVAPWRESGWVVALVGLSSLGAGAHVTIWKMGLFSGAKADDGRFAAANWQTPRQAETASSAPLRVDFYGDPLPVGALARLGTRRLLAQGRLNSLIFTSDGNSIVMAGDQDPARVWSLTTGRLVHRFEQIHDAVLSTDGRVLVGRTKKGLSLWDVAEGKPIRDMGLDDAVAFAPDGKTMVTLREESAQGLCNLSVCDAATGKPLWQYSHKSEKGASRRPLVVAIDAYSSDSKTFISQSGSDLLLWEVATGKRLWQWSPRRKTEHLTSYVRSRDGSQLAASIDQGSGNCLLCLADVTSTKETRTIVRMQSAPGTHTFVSALAMSPDGNILAAGTTSFGARNRIRLWNLRSGEELQSCEGTIFENVNRLAFSSNGRRIAAGVRDWSGRSSSLRLWDTASKHELPLPRTGHTCGVGSVLFSADGKDVISGGRGADARVWDGSTGKQRLQLKFDDSEPDLTWFAMPIALAPHSAKVAMMVVQNTRAHPFPHSERRISIWDTCTGKQLHTISLPSDGALHAVFSRHGAKLLCGASGIPEEIYDDGVPGEHPDQCELWDLAERKKLHIILGCNGRFLPAGKELVTIVAKEEKGVEAVLWDVGTGEKLASVPYRLDEAQAVLPPLKDERATRITFSPDGSMLVAERTFHGVDDVYLVLSPISFTVDCGQRKGTIGPVSRVIRLSSHSPKDWSISGDCHTLAWRGDKGVVHLLEIASGNDRSRFQGDADDATSLAFSPHSRRLAISYVDSTILVWDATGRLERDARVRPLRLTPTQAQECWEKLGNGDAAVAGTAIWTLIAGAPTSVSFLENRLHLSDLETAPLAETVDKLIAQLDHGAYVIRAKAIKRLEALGDLALPQIKSHMGSKMSGDKAAKVKKLVEAGVTRAAAGVSAGDELRGIRVAEVLEQIGSRNSHRLLQVLAANSQYGRVTLAARRAIYRLKQAP